MAKHELFEELDAANPRWQTEFRTTQQAAYTYGLGALFVEWLRTPAGEMYRRVRDVSRDYVQDNLDRAAQLAAERSMAAAASRDRSAVNLEDTLTEDFDDVPSFDA